MAVDGEWNVVVGIRMASMGSYVWILVPSWWMCLGLVRRFDLVGAGVLLGWALKFQETQDIPRVLSLLCL